MKRGLFFVLFLTLTFSAQADRVKAKVEYVDVSETELDVSYIDILAKRVEFMLGGTSYEFSANYTFKKWEIMFDSSPMGEVTLIEGEDDSDNSWKFEYEEGPAVEVSFYGYNDPRSYKTSMDGEKPLTMKNGEPDCNSYFTLWGKDPGSGYVNPNKAMAFGEASHLCGRANWFFEIQTKKYNERMMAAYIFTAVVAMNVRGFRP